MYNNKKIIIIGSAYPLRGGGIASYNERLAREFMSQGYDTSIYTFSLQYPKFLFPGTTQYSTEPPPADLKIKVRINSINPFNWIKVGNELKNIKPDIIVVRYWLPFMGPCFGTILRRVKKNRHTKVICIADNIIPHEKRLGDISFTKYFVKPVDAFITMSKKVLQDLQQFVKNKPSQFVPHPLYDNFGEKVSKDDARQKLGIHPEDKVILFFGFIRKYKGLDILLKVMAVLKHQGQKIKLLIAGEFYGDKSVYEDLIDGLEIRDNLILHTHFIADSEVKYYLCAADCVVQPYRNATQSGVTPLAYHFERPMIVSNVGGLPDMVPGKVGLVAEPDANDIAEKIIQFFALGEDYFLPHLREEKKKYRWNNMVQAIIDLAAK
ncbi:MAG TPA: glycosyltransferase family 4 protein [Chitinophagaceae bacterium]|nr:glycosyltransferase family 4 protein [Chitinophagaceae bacterium]